MAIGDEDPEVIELDSEETPGLIGYIKQKFVDAENGRLSDERRWLKSYKNYRGITDNESSLRSSEKSKVFIKITKVKVLAAFGQIIDILFANNKFPISVTSTPVPEGVSEFAHLPMPEEQQIPNELKDTPLSELGFDGNNLDEFLAGLAEKYKDSNLVEGPSKFGSPQIEPAKETARKLEKTIHDQLTDTNAATIFRHSIFECCLLGTGVIKGPFNFNKTVHNWEVTEEGKTYEPYDKTVPRIEAISCWDFYPDPAAVSVEDAEYVIQRHRLSKDQLRSLIQRPYFNKEEIRATLSEAPNYEERYFEPVLHTEDDDPLFAEKRYEVLEYWGTLDASLARLFGLDVPVEIDDLDAVQVNAWISNGHVLRLVLNPFVPARIPYYTFPYELNPYQLFGIGVAENMEDSQLLMNGHMRMAIDNLALAGNMVFDIDETQLVPGQNMEVYPGKIFRRQSGQSGKGDLEIKPKGAAAIMQKEVRTQRLTALLQTVVNPMLAPFIKIPNLIRELAISQDIDPDQLVNDPNEAAIFADILRGLANASGNGPETSPNSQQPSNMGANTAVPTGANPMDPSGVGGGTIGIGNTPVAGESNFTGESSPTEGTGEIQLG